MVTVVIRASLLISMIDTPWAFNDLLVFSSFQLAMPSGKSRPSSAYSLFCARRPCRDPSIGKYTRPSLCVPHCCAWSAALLLASGSNSGPFDTGSPQAMSTSAVYPGGTTTVSAVDTSMP